jgi:hypothetical protein
MGCHDHSRPLHAAALAPNTKLHIVTARITDRFCKTPGYFASALLINEGQREVSHGHTLVDRVPGWPEDCRIDPDKFAIRIEPVFPAIGIIGYCPKTILIFSEFLLHTLAFGDIDAGIFAIFSRIFVYSSLDLFLAKTRWRLWHPEHLFMKVVISAWCPLMNVEEQIRT